MGGGPKSAEARRLPQLTYQTQTKILVFSYYMNAMFPFLGLPSDSRTVGAKFCKAIA
jgi:hypothetical protein